MRTAWAALLLIAGCRDTLAAPDVDASTPPSIAELTAAHVDGERVSLRTAVVLAEDTLDETATGRVGTIYVVDPGDAETRGGLSAFAPAKKLPPGSTLRPGDLVDMDGRLVRFRGPGCVTTGSSCFEDDRAIVQLERGASVDRVGFYLPPEPLDVAVDELLANPERYQGNLVTVRDLIITNTYAPASGGSRLASAETEQGLDIGADLYVVPDLAVGTHIRRLTGIAGYFFTDFVLPRSAADVELEP